MKPDWDKLMDEFKGSATQLVADGELREGELCDVCADCLMIGSSVFHLTNPAFSL